MTDSPILFGTHSRTRSSQTNKAATVLCLCELVFWHSLPKALSLCAPPPPSARGGGTWLYFSFPPAMGPHPGYVHAPARARGLRPRGRHRRHRPPQHPRPAPGPRTPQFYNIPYLHSAPGRPIPGSYCFVDLPSVPGSYCFVDLDSRIEGSCATWVC